MITLSDLIEVTEHSDVKRNSYQQLLWESENGSEWNKSYAKAEMAKYHFKRPNKSLFDRLTLKWLGQLPDNFVLEMDKVKTKRLVITLTAWALTLLLTGLTTLMLIGVNNASILSVSSLILAPLAFVPSPINWIMLAVFIWSCWQFRKEIGSFFRTGMFVWSRSVVEDEKSESSEVEAGVKTMTFVSGAENWSGWQKVKSVLLSTLAIPFLAVLIYPVAFLPAMIGFNVFVLAYYLKQYRKYNDPIQATIETTRTVALYKTILPIQLGVSFVIWLLNLPLSSHLGQLVSKLVEQLAG